jgi:hypothetical protein
MIFNGFKQFGIVFLFLFLLGISACDTNREPYVFPTEYDLEYQVTGTSSRANITYQDLKGNYVEVTNATLPWNYQAHYYDSMVGTSVYLDAQSLDPAASVTVTINAKGALYKQATLSGDYIFVAIYGALP